VCEYAFRRKYAVDNTGDIAIPDEVVDLKLLLECRHERNVLQKICAERSDEIDRLRAENEALKEIISSGMQKAEGMAADRYSVVRGAFWWRVKVGDGQHTEGRCYTKVESERLAAALRTAFLDGAFVVARHTALRGKGE
jgi:hypothetical protein